MSSLATVVTRAVHAVYGRWSVSAMEGYEDDALEEYVEEGEEEEDLSLNRWQHLQPGQYRMLFVPLRELKYYDPDASESSEEEMSESSNDPDGSDEYDSADDKEAMESDFVKAKRLAAKGMHGLAAAGGAAAKGAKEAAIMGRKVVAAGAAAAGARPRTPRYVQTAGYKILDFGPIPLHTDALKLGGKNDPPKEAEKGSGGKPKSGVSAATFGKNSKQIPVEAIRLVMPFCNPRSIAAAVRCGSNWRYEVRSAFPHPTDDRKSPSRALANAPLARSRCTTGVCRAALL